MFDDQSTTAKMMTNSNFQFVTSLLELCKANSCAIYYGSSETSANASEN